MLLKRLIKEQPLGAFGGVVLLLLILVGIFAGSLAGHDPNQMTLADRLQGPSGEYPLGTDQLGRDFLSASSSGLASRCSSVWPRPRCMWWLPC